MRKLLARFYKDETGATAIEYGAAAIIAIVGTIGSNLNTGFTSISSQLK
jgi:pilus assembly protein Flp/PilA